MNLNDLLDRPTLNVTQIAQKHNVSVEYVAQQLKKGIKVEIEHTSHLLTAVEIALDHLSERPDYYTQLKKVETNESSTTSMFKDFLPVAKKELGLAKLPKIKSVTQVPGADGTTFGRYNPESKTIYVVTQGRHPKDALRTLAHELVHYRQDCENKLNHTSGETGSPEENEANATAGVMMRNFNQANPEVQEATPVTPVAPVKQDPIRTKYNQVPRNNDPASQTFKDVLHQTKNK